MSLAISGVTRINEPLGGLLDSEDGGNPATVTVNDADGTSHVFTLRADELLGYEAPPGVNLRLRQYSNVLEDAAGLELVPEQREQAWAITRPDGVTQFFDGWGFLRSIEDRNGNVMTFEYENVLIATGEPCLPDVVVPGVCEPRLARVVDAAGTEAPGGSPERVERTIAIDYHPVLDSPLGGAAGKIRRITDHGGRALEFAYDDRGFLTSMTEAAGTPEARTTRLAYDEPELTEVGKHPQLVKVTDPRGGETSFSYYEDTALEDIPSRRLFQVENRRGDTRTLSYEGDQQDHSVGTSATVTDGRGETWDFALDLRDRPIDLTDPLATREHLEWDSDNNVIAHTEAAGSDDEARTDFTYNDNGLLTSQSDPLGRTTHLSYEEGAGMHRSEYGTLTSLGEQSIDDDGDAFVSDLVRVRRPAANAWTSDLEPDVASDGSPTTNGNVIAQSDPLGNTARSDYNPDGTPSSETTEVGDETTYSSYDANGMPQVVIAPRGNSGEEPANEHRWLYRYDAVGNLLSATDPRGSAGHLPGGPAPETFTTELGYDALDRVVLERVPKDSEAGELITRRYEHDRNDNMVARIDGEGERWSHTYTPMDRIASESTPLDERTEYGYDAEEGLVEVVAPEGARTAAAGDHATRLELDAIGRRVATIRESTEDESLITSYAYDRRDNATGIALPRDNTTALGTAVAVPEALLNAGRPEGQRLALTYDRANQQVAQVEDPDGEALRTEQRYDQNGNLRTVLGPRGFEEGPDPAAFARITDYDDRDLPVAETDELGNRTELERRADGLVSAETRPNGSHTALEGDYTIDYGYDANGELESRSLPWRAGQYGLSNAELDSQHVSYERDAVGNPVQVVDARGKTITNSFYDTGELRSTNRPSWWGLDWGAGQATPAHGERYTEAGGSGATEPDVMVPAGGPQLSEAPRPEDGGGTNDGAAGAALTPGGNGATDFGSVEAEELSNGMPQAGMTRFSYDDELRMTAVEPQNVADREAHPFEIAYDRSGRIAEKAWPLDPHGDSAPTPGFVRHSFDYDRNGNLTSFVNGEGNCRAGPRAPTRPASATTSSTAASRSPRRARATSTTRRSTAS